MTALLGPSGRCAAPAPAAAATPDLGGRPSQKRFHVTIQTTMPAVEPDAEPDIAAEAPAQPKTFAELGVDPAIVEALAADGIHTAFPIQELTLPLALAGQDLIGQAKTGTGKTLGFGIPLLMKLVAPDDDGFGSQPDPVRGKPQALVVVPTRELGVQVAADLAKAGKRLGVRVLCVYGGRAYEPQVEALQNGIEVVVGTPGRLIDLARQRHLDLGHVKILVLDEADEMLDMGFLPDVERIVALVPAVRQTMLFSATMPGKIVSLARRYMTQPTHIRAIDPHDDSATRRRDRAARLARPQPRQERDHRPGAAVRRTRPDHGLLPHQAQRPARRRRPDRARLRGRRGARRPRPGGPRAGAARVPERQGRRPRRHRRGGARHRRRPTSPTSSTGSARTTRRPTCTASVVPGGPARTAWRSRSSTGTTCTAGS